MENWTEKTRNILGDDGDIRLKNARVLVFGIGGVGSFAAEALVRAGVGTLTFVDGDSVCETNLNRQMIALRSTLGINKAEVMRRRALDINPDVNVTVRAEFVTPENADTFDFASYDYVADAIDDVPAKTAIAVCSAKAGVPLISSMGTGGKLDPTLLRIADIFKTEGDPLARIMRRELRKNGIERLNVVYSPEAPRMRETEDGKKVFGTVSFVPSSAGLLIAGKIIRDIAEGAYE